MIKNKLFLSLVFTLCSMLMFGQEDKATTYDFRDGAIIESTQSSDGVVTLEGNFKHHGTQYGLNMKVDGVIKIKVDGSSTVRFLGSKHSSLHMKGVSETGTDLGTLPTKVVNDIVDTFEFDYVGGATTLSFILVPEGSDLYLPSLDVIPIEIEIKKTDVWDFGATQLDDVLYNNHLTVDAINAWYASDIKVGSSGSVLPSTWSTGILSWDAINSTNDRLRTTNEKITRYDENVSNGGDDNYVGRLYVNSSGKADRRLIIELNEDDVVTLVAKTDSGGVLTFDNLDENESQKDEVDVVGDIVEVSFTAKTTGRYAIYDSKGKPSYFRLYRATADYSTVTGTVNIDQAGEIPENYLIQYTNTAGKTWSANVGNGMYSVDLPQNDTYSISLSNANGFIITNGDSLEVSEATTTHDITILKVDLYNVTGSIIGLDDASNLALNFTPDPNENKLYIPVVAVNAEDKTFSVKLEATVEYTISAEGVNDYEIENNTITIGAADETSNITFSKKPVYDVDITAAELNPEQLSNLTLTFKNINEENAVYTFASVSGIKLRDGTYAITYDGLNKYPLELALTSNLKIDGANTSKELDFEVVTNWSFNDQIIAPGDEYYKGLMFSGSPKNEIDKGHLNLGADATIAIPVNAGEKIILTYYYAANFSIEGGEPITTNSGSTSTFESSEYIYTGTDEGTVTLTTLGTTYITNIEIQSVVEFMDTITVGTDKDYQTINEALAAISQMVRPNQERVTVLIDPGNYEEMLVVNSANVTLKNASAVPSIAVHNKGVDIDPNAVRITSYYGHGYNYYSMGIDQKWHADILATNKANGYLSYENKGAGTTNGSFWNATLVVMANGFEAQDLIIENSFNQYISKKESEDILELIPSENKGQRPTNIENTEVQDRNFVERAAAIAIPNNTDKVVLQDCKIIGRQDTFFGGYNTRVVVVGGEVLGAVDFIFGGMTAVFYKTDLVMNTSDVSSDAAYVTAAQQDSGRGYLMYECTVTSTDPGTETASTKRAKPGYFGRPWKSGTSEVVFYNTTIETTNFSGSEDLSLIQPIGWLSSLGGESEYMYEYGTIENSSVNNSISRAPWSTVLSTPVLKDGMEITTFNFTKGHDDWDPIGKMLSVHDGNFSSQTSVLVKAYKGQLYISNVKSETKVEIYNTLGQVIRAFKTNQDVNVAISGGLYIAKINAADGDKIVKFVAH